MALNRNLSPAYGVSTSRAYGSIVLAPAGTSVSIVRTDFPCTVSYVATGIYRVTLAEKLPAAIELDASYRHTSLVDGRVQVGTYTQSTGVIDVLGQTISTGAAGTLAAGTITLTIDCPEIVSSR